ncbi:MAG: phage tail tape measure protein [Weeksellaceae bacterium]|nr:phage tail tape measure protein [Weeksellaceae bacterium]
MADNTTSWVLNFVDMVTTPIKKMISSIAGATNSYRKMEETAGKSQLELRLALEESKEKLKQLRKELNSAEKGLTQIGLLLSQSNPGKAQEQLRAEFSAQEKKVTELKRSIAATNIEVQDFKSEIKELGKTGTTSFGKLAFHVNQTLELMNKLSRSLEFTIGYTNQKTEIQRLTDLTGDALTEYTNKSREIADVYSQDAVEVAKSVNAMTKQFGGSYEENFNLLEEGFKRGADLSGNLLSNMERYSGALSDMGISASDAMVIMAKAEKDGIDADKVIDSIKRAGDAITELAPSQKKALEDIGVGVEELAGKTKWEAIRMVSEAMKGMSEQAKQNVLAKIFGEAGKESGLSFVQGLAEEIPDLSSLPAVEESAAGFKRFFSNVKSWAGDTFGNFGIYATQMAPMVQTIAGAIPVIQTLTKSQWLLNIAMYANPIGIIIGLIAALVGIIVVAIQKYDEWGAALLQILGPIGYVIGAIKSLKDNWESVKEAFTTDGIIDGLKRLNLVLYDAILKPMQQIFELLPGNWAKKQADRIREFRQKSDLVTEGEKNAETKKTSNELSINQIIKGEPVKNTYTELNEDKTKPKSKKESGLAISGKGGVANITMTINNYFTASAGTNIRQLADQVAGKISDRLQDAIVSV